MSSMDPQMQHAVQERLDLIDRCVKCAREEDRANHHPDRPADIFTLIETRTSHILDATRELRNLLLRQL